MDFLRNHRRLTVACFAAAVIVAAAILFGADLIGGSSEQSTTEPSQAKRFQFGLDELEASLTPLEDLIDDPSLTENGTRTRRNTDPSQGIVTDCRNRFHAKEFSLQQQAVDFTAAPGPWIGAKREIYLLADEAAARELFGGLADTPIGCDLSPISVINEIVSTVTISEFEGFDAVTVVLETTTYDDDQSAARNAELAVVVVETDHWVRHGNVVVRVTTRGESAVDVTLLLSDALAGLETLAV